MRMEKMTDIKVRMTTSERLGIDLSNANNKKFIKSVLVSFLLSTIEDAGDARETDSNSRRNEMPPNPTGETN